jgi:putative oxidoreductase
MLARLLQTDDDRVMLALRLALAVVIFPHGAQKVFGWFGGYGLGGSMGFLTGALHVPAWLAALDIVAEFGGAIGLAVGLLGRVAAFGLACVMVAAVALVHLPNGFFMNWTGLQKGEGFEFHLLVLALAVAVMVRGSGAFSLDRLLARRAAAARTR